MSGKREGCLATATAASGLLVSQLMSVKASEHQYWDEVGSWRCGASLYWYSRRAGRYWEATWAMMRIWIGRGVCETGS